MTTRDLMDELPSPPAAGAEEGAEPVSGEFDAGLLADVPKFGEPFPVGTYHFRLESYDESWNNPDAKATEQYGDLAKQPQFALHWTCQQEPHTGRTYLDFVPWVSSATVARAGKGDAVAKQIIRNRLGRVKQLLEAVGYKAVGAFDVKEVLGTNPEVKIQLNLRESKTRTPDGKLVPSGEMRNNTVKFVALHRQA